MVGVLAAAAGIAVGHLVAALLDPASSPVLAVGSHVIDATPTPVKDWAIEHFGTSDKTVLLSSVILVTLLLAALAGALSRVRVAAGVGFVLLLTGLATAAALDRPVSSFGDAVPGVAAAAVGTGVLLGLVRTLRTPHTRTSPRAAQDSTRADDVVTSAQRAELPATMSAPPADGRRAFLVGAAGVGVGAAGIALFGQKLSDRSTTVNVRLPKPSSPAKTLPADLSRKIKGISPLRTPTSSFYRVDTNLSIPAVDVGSWELAVDGMVDHPFTLSYQDLLKMPLIERNITMTCVSNDVGGGYIGAATWLGVRVKDILERAGVQHGVDQIMSTAVDGFTISTPLDALVDGREAMIAVAMNGSPLPAKHGFPARMITPGLYGFVGATKWLTKLTATTYDGHQAYWTKRGWATDAPIKTSSRIDTPQGLSNLKAGQVTLGGVAWAQLRGIRRVEVSIDRGPWQRATLGPDVGIDYWRQWYFLWDAKPGSHSLRVRAIDATGAVQIERRAKPFPNGSSGIQDIVVSVR